MDVTLLEELTSYEPCRMRPNGFGITVREYMAEKNCSETVARKLLDAAKDAGVLDMHLMKLQEKHQVQSVYHRPADWPPSNVE